MSLDRLFTTSVVLLGLSSTSWGQTPVDPEPRVGFGLSQNMEFGVSVIKDAAGKPSNKRLTYSADGGTNSTVLRIDGKDYALGQSSGKWVEKPIAVGGRGKAVWAVGGVQVRLLVEVVPGKQPVEVAKGVHKRLLDTCIVKYEIENHDAKAHAVGLRLQLDTLIGGNDGVPFAVPGLPGVVNTFRDFKTASEVPDFIQALESGNLKNPGTVAHLTLKLGGGLEPPSRVSLTHWLRSNAWEVPVVNMGTDSAVVLYWNADKVLPPGGRRDVGFAYGLGSVSSSEQGDLRLTIDGQFVVGKAVNVLAYVNNPRPNQTLTLKLPAGLDRVEGKATETVTAPKAGGAKGTSLVTWKIQASKAGAYTVAVASSTGAGQAKAVTFEPAPSSFQFAGFEVPSKETPTIQAAVDKAKGTTTIVVHPRHKDPGFLISGKENITILTLAGTWVTSIYGPRAGTTHWEPPMYPKQVPEVRGVAAVDKSKNISLGGLLYTGGIHISESVKITATSGWVDGGVYVHASNLVQLEWLKLLKEGSPGIYVHASFVDPANALRRWRKFGPLDVPYLGDLQAAFGTPAVHVFACTFSKPSGAAVSGERSHVRVSGCTMTGVKGPGVTMAHGCLAWVGDCNMNDVKDNGVLFWKSEGYNVGNHITKVRPVLGFGRGIEIYPPDPVKDEPAPYNNLGTPGSTERDFNTVTDCPDAGILIERGIGPINAYVRNCGYGVLTVGYKGRINGQLKENTLLGLFVGDTEGPVVIGDWMDLHGHPGAFSAVILNARNVRASMNLFPSWGTSWTNPQTAIGGLLIDNSEVTLKGERLNGGLTLNNPNALGGLIVANGSKVRGIARVELGGGPGIVVDSSAWSGTPHSARNFGVGMLLYNADAALDDPVLEYNAAGGILAIGGTVQLTKGSLIGYPGPYELRGRSFAGQDFHVFGVRGLAGAKIKASGTFLSNWGRAGLWLDGAEGEFNGVSLSSFRYRDWGRQILWYEGDHDALLVENGAKATFTSGMFHIMGGKGARVRTGGQLTLSQNNRWVNTHGDQFLQVEDGGEATAVNGRLDVHTGYGVKVLAGGKATIKNYRLNVNFGDGIYLHKDSKAELTANWFDWVRREVPLDKKTYVAIRIEPGAEATLKNNVGGARRDPVDGTPPASARLSKFTDFFQVAWHEQDQPTAGKADDTKTPPLAHAKARADILKALGEIQPTKQGKTLTPPTPRRGPTTLSGDLGPSIGAAALTANAGHALGMGGDWQGAAAAFREALRDNPDNAEVRLGLARSLFQHNQAAEAVQELREATRRAPRHAGAWAELAAALNRQKNGPEAEKASQTAVALEARTSGNYLLLAEALRLQGRLDEAATAALKALELGAPATAVPPLLAEQLAAAGLAHATAGKAAQAVAVLRQATLLAPKRPDFQAYLSDALLQANQAAEAVKTAQRATELAPHLANNHARLARALVAAGNKTQAEAAFRAAAALDSRYHQILAHWLLAQGKLGEADLAFRQALQADPKSAKLQSELAALALRQRRPAEALHFAQQAVDQGLPAAQLAPAVRELADKGVVENRPYGTEQETVRPATLAGKWIGTWKNSVGETGEDVLDLSENPRGGWSGTWLNLSITAEAIGDDAWVLVGKNGTRSYRAVARLTDAGLRIDYAAHVLENDQRYRGQSLLRRVDLNTPK